MRALAAVLLVSSLSLLSGCGRGVGARCAATSECSDGLVCVSLGDATMSGACEPPGGSDMPLVAPVDLSSSD